MEKEEMFVEIKFGGLGPVSGWGTDQPTTTISSYETENDFGISENGSHRNGIQLYVKSVYIDRKTMLSTPPIGPAQVISPRPVPSVIIFISRA
jgi:hypothetical protein